MKKYNKNLLILAIVAVLGVGVAIRPTSVNATVPNESDLISLNSSNNGQGGNNNSGQSMPSGDGKYVAFESDASNLVSSDTNVVKDVFVRDLTNNITERINVSSSGVQANGECYLQAISKTGRYVAFITFTATNLIDNETNTHPGGHPDVYLRDRQTGQTTLLNKNSSGSKAYDVHVTGVSDDGRFIAVDTNAWNLVTENQSSVDRKAVLLDRATNTWKYLGTNDGNGSSDWWGHVQMNCDGAVAAFTGSDYKVYIADRRTGAQLTDITTGANNDSRDARISCDGRYVGFQTYATNLVSGTTPNDGKPHLIRYDRIMGTYIYLDIYSSGSFISRTSTYNTLDSLRLSNNGGAIFTLMDSSAPYYAHIYARNVEANTTESVNLTYSGGSTFQTSLGFLGIDEDGKYVTYASNDSANIVQGDSNGYTDAIRSKTGW